MKKSFKPQLEVIHFEANLIAASKCLDSHNCISCFCAALTCDDYTCTGFSCPEY